ncbi:hypothetical protein TNIN_297261 [Trichonephila inaurata madagascariensis]|uniref:Uncharacterized protein n=1 Tax=Trichonephila inaurata madagascariensis TaxID=2747483 RepID=A0A8X6WTS8_9ARAC|nr:hypothetical protein TNIN_297261 [Trichonephila inaurata madagascariensis]
MAAWKPLCSDGLLVHCRIQRFVIGARNSNDTFTVSNNLYDFLLATLFLRSRFTIRGRPQRAKRFEIRQRGVKDLVGPLTV